jgi:hypothetical protein
MASSTGSVTGALFVLVAALLATAVALGTGDGVALVAVLTFETGAGWHPPRIKRANRKILPPAIRHTLFM